MKVLHFFVDKYQSVFTHRRHKWLRRGIKVYAEVFMALLHKKYLSRLIYNR